MLTLVLLRHAKSSWNNPTLPDQDRPLATRGANDAPLMGRAMAERGIDPDLVLCSSARRTRDTLALVLPELKVEPEVVYRDELYHPSPMEMLGLLHEVPASASRLLMVGHNPELQAFALNLVGSGPKHYRDRMREKYPTAGLAVINFPSGSWKGVDLGSGTLNLFLSPKELRK
ncbi:histidine phosphatase family protein [Methyloceanibacter sp.]|uniref:SixA phosphatase family protein n=1 Tax=Methyloceanibacter sp. TaxID=1965321 RepID=UPI002D568D5E|nr:histidine phosphatase family protein [Methyloceanibacter sp.]HZP09905.1 histidine phosphatase family protein [Methyloceanibacter sp.]